MNKEVEIWKDIPGYEGLYQVSNLGRVKSLPKEWTAGKGSLMKHNGKILKMHKDCKGYYTISFKLNKKSKTYKVHQLVAMAFLNHKPCGMNLVVDHMNDVKTDNRVENLQIITNRENSYRTQVNYSSKYKGVYWHKKANKWASYIYLDGKRKHLGLYIDEDEAAKVYKQKLKEYEQKIN